ncbi:MAG: hypothetical protein ACFCGT_16730 [Sandaracinaceae bacterium]
MTGHYVWFFVRRNEKTGHDELVLTNQQHDYLAVVFWCADEGDYVFRDLSGTAWEPELVDRALAEARRRVLGVPGGRRRDFAPDSCRGGES